MTTGKTTALMRQTCVGKVMSLLFNMLSRLVLTFLPRSKCLLISWLQSPCAVILEPKKIKFVTISIVSPSICHEVTIWCWHKNRNIDQWNKIESLEINPHTCSQLIHNKGGKNIQLQKKKNSPFNK